jgi:hypothetical protein
MTVATISLFLIPTVWAWMHGIRAGKGAAD